MLRAIHCPLSYAIGTLRLSVGRYTTKQDVEEAAEIIIAAVYKLLEQPSVNQKLAWELYNVDPGTDIRVLLLNFRVDLSSSEGGFGQSEHRT